MKALVGVEDLAGIITPRANPDVWTDNRYAACISFDRFLPAANAGRKKDNYGQRAAIENNINKLLIQRLCTLPSHGNNSALFYFLCLTSFPPYEDFISRGKISLHKNMQRPDINISNIMWHQKMGRKKTKQNNATRWKKIQEDFGE